jgi:hypothetical protein
LRRANLRLLSAFPRGRCVHRGVIAERHREHVRRRCHPTVEAAHAFLGDFAKSPVAFDEKVVVGGAKVESVADPCQTTGSTTSFPETKRSRPRCASNSAGHQARKSGVDLAPPRVRRSELSRHPRAPVRKEPVSRKHPLSGARSSKKSACGLPNLMPDSEAATGAVVRSACWRRSRHRERSH